MAERRDPNERTSIFLDIEDIDYDHLPPNIGPTLAAAKHSFDVKDYKKALEVADSLVVTAINQPGHFTNVLHVMKILFLVSKCLLELNDFIQAKKVLDNICNLVHDIYPDKIHELDSYIIEIEERQRNIAGAFVLSIVFQEIHHTGCAEKLQKLKAQLVHNYCCQANFMDNVFNPLFHTAKTYLEIEEFDLAAAIFKELMQILSDSHSSDELKTLVRLNLKLATSKLSTSNKQITKSDPSQTTQGTTSEEFPPIHHSNETYVSQSYASNNILGQPTTGDLYAHSEPTLGVHQTSRILNKGTLKSSEMPTEGASLPNKGRGQGNVGKKTTGMAGIQTVGLPPPVRQSETVINEQTNSNLSKNAEEPFRYSKKEMISSDVKESPTKQNAQDIRLAGSSARCLNTKKPLVQTRNYTQGQKQAKTPNNEQARFILNTDESNSSRSSSESAEKDDESSEITSEESHFRDETDDSKSIDRSDMESISDMSEANDGFQTVSSRKRLKSRSCITLPNGIAVICAHFQANPTRHYKVCKGCEANCFFAYSSAVSKRWERVRRSPTFLTNSKQELHSCFKYKQGKQCNTQCNHPHGPELDMWELERRKVILEPRRYLQIASGPETSSQTRKKPRRKKRNKKNATKNTNERPSTNPAVEEAAISGHAPQQMTQQPSTQDEISPSQEVCYLPKEVTIACPHFFRQYGEIPIAIRDHRRRNVCKKCLLLKAFSDVKYAFWSNKFKRWYKIRDRPTNLLPHVKFQHCKNFIRGQKCGTNKCTFGHGPEVSMWTMEALATPEEAYFSNIQDETMNREGLIRPLSPNCSLTMCRSVQAGMQCRLGRCCTSAHSTKELTYWQKRYKYIFDQQQQQQQQQQEPQSSSQTQQWLLQPYLQHRHEQKQQQQHLLPSEELYKRPRAQPYKTTQSFDNVNLTCNPKNPNISLTEETDDKHEYRWTFCLCYQTNQEMKLPTVFLGKRHSNYFHFERMQIIITNAQGRNERYIIADLAVNQLISLKIPNSILTETESCKVELEIVVRFRCRVNGSFPQNLLFDFGNEPLLIREFNIDVAEQDGTLSMLDTARQNIFSEAVQFDDSDAIRDENDDDKSQLVSGYKLPKNAESFVSAQMLDESGQMTPASYADVMHQMLFSEEAHMKNLLARLIPSNARINVSKKIDDESKGMEIAPDGYLFGTIELDTSVTLDDMAGRVCFRKVRYIIIQACDRSDNKYEAKIKMLKEKQVIVLLYPRLVQDLKIEDDRSVSIEMWFSLDREILCRMHEAIDRLSETHKPFLFPETQDVNIFKRMRVPWLEELDKELNDNQLQVISTILEVQPPCAPLVVFGPFGTGKTLTLNRAILHLAARQSNRVLLCTHTNSAADIHIKLLDEFMVKNKLTDAKPLRIYDTKRKLQTVLPKTQQYCLIEDNSFVMPSRQDVEKHRVVVTTLTTADHLRKLKVRNGFFTHILIDEAAQAWETEALIPIALAGPNTKIVFTGDHMQMSPEVYSKFDCQYGLKKSLPERLFDHYRQMEGSVFTDRQMIFLKHNYRSNNEILKFPSENFYGGEIVAMGDEENPAHPTFGPMIFYACRGAEQKRDNSFLNEAEVNEVVNRVKELAENWPPIWGKKNLAEIAVLAAYKYQVDTIRGELRKLRLGKVTVTTIHDVQGLEFRALFISTVRTRQSNQDLQESEKNSNMEFLSDPKLLVTAVTRAKSLVAVVGDPVALCTLGECQTCWRDFISRCDTLETLHGITMAELSIAPQKNLNPDAPSFVPKRATGTKLVVHQDDVIKDNDERDEDDGEEEDDDLSSSSGDDIEDTFVEKEQRIEDPPQHLDKIIQALVEYKTIKEKRKESTLKDLYPGDAQARKPCEMGLSPTDYEMVRTNGRDETRLIISMHRDPSDRAIQTQKTQYQGDFDQQDNLSPEVLKRMVEDEPDKYKICRIRIGQNRSRATFLEFQETTAPDVKISSQVRQAFDRDTVVVDTTKIKATGSSKADCIVGILHHLINPREREYVCRLSDLDDRANAPMLPIKKSIPKIANLSDENYQIIPIYRRADDSAQRPFKVREVDPVKAREKKLLFVVQFLQWRSDCHNPLGIAIKTLGKVETIKDSLKVAQIEHGVKQSRHDEVKAEAEESFPPCWVIPESERRHRKVIQNAFTIDPEGSKDLDDAISIDQIDSETYKIGIHIADVSFFVKPGSKVDDNARLLGTTYYSVNPDFENIPMLPSCLSENHCSLKQNEDRLTQSVYVIINKNGKVITYPDQIESTITKSCCQLTYSQAQRIIEHEVVQVENACLLEQSIPLLHSLAQKLRRRRLGAAKHSDEIHDIAAHELIEEMMILANRTVGKILSERPGQHNATPFLSHREPKLHKLNEWVTRYGKFARYNPFMNALLQGRDIDMQYQERLPEIHIFGPIWNDMMKLTHDKKYEMIHYLICHPRCSPQLQLANNALKRIQTRSEYSCSKDDGPIHHYGLEIDNYVHFTSPIRRYMDIVIHRQVKSDIVEEDLDKMDAFCRRSTFIKGNSREYQRECKRICHAYSLKESNEGIEVLVDELESHSFVVHTTDPELDLFYHHNNRISFQDLSVSDDPEEPDGNLETTLKWRVRLYISPTSKENATEIAKPWVRERKRMKNDLFSSNSLKELDVRTIQGQDWLQLIELAVEENNGNEINDLIENIQKTSERNRSAVQQHRTPGSVSDTANCVDVQPYHDDRDGHYYTITMKLRQFNTVYVQLFCSLFSTLPTPDIQLFKITSSFDVCLEHQRFPRQCFARNHYVNASLPRPYDSIEDYIKHWKPVLDMEIVAGAVRGNEGFVLRHHRIKWSRGEGGVVGTFSLKDDFCFARQLFFHQGDLACVRIPRYDGEKADAKKSVWVGHCVLTKVENSEDQKKVKVTVKVILDERSAPEIPDILFLDDGLECDMQAIQVPVPLRRMNFALTVALKTSSNLVTSVCCGWRTGENTFNLPGSHDLSLAARYPWSGFYRLNDIQRKAVSKALGNAFSLIQGPPGTGKTVTGVHIAYWFTKQNSHLKPLQDSKDGQSEINETKESEEDGETNKKKESNAPPQVLYCGPSNKSVDVVTEYLLRIPDMKDKILRVYGSMIEETEFPIPNKVTNLKPSVSDDELKIPDGELKEVSLHHIIRSDASPFGRQLKKMEDQFHENKTRDLRTPDEDVKEYCKLIYEAEVWVIEKTGKEIILCTCSRSGSKLIKDTCNIIQCIVDESGMCMEPEVLVPLTSSDATQIVLIGDHQQLQPIVADKQAGKLGLVKSMFERLYKEADMLEIQYRMHSSICDFPSYCFYNHKLITDVSVKNRQEKNLDFWPSPHRGPVAFCHIEGLEEVSAIATADSGAESKYNEQEASKVVQVAKLLVNKHGVDKKDIVILTPYREQRKIISEKLKDSNCQDIKVITIIKSQGSEWDFVILSLVRSVPKDDIDPEPSLEWLTDHLGFITDPHQINVALTRAKHGLCIVGNRNLIELNETWWKLLKHYEDRHYIVEDYEWPEDRRYQEHPGWNQENNHQ